MDKIIFLDIDGVLNLMRPERDQYGSLFHEHFVSNLKTIIDATEAKIVISSTWRMSGESVMKDMWKHRNLPGEVIGITENIRYNSGRDDNDVWRGHEIQAYIDKYNIIDYVILDDDSDMLKSQLNNFVKTSGNYDHSDYLDIGYGLTKECAEQAIQILNKKV